MKRRTPSSGPGHLVTFDVGAWAEPGDRPGFWRYEAALHRWLQARHEWAEAHGWDGDDEWLAGEHEAVRSLPDEPWDGSKI